MSEKLKKNFAVFHASNPHVYKLLVKYTLQAINAGRKNYSINAIFERARWHSDIETTGSRFKLSNNHRAYYARLFHLDFPQYLGFFRTRN